VDEAGQQEDDDEAARGAGKADDGADGRVGAGEGDADGEHEQVDGGDVEQLLLLAAHEHQECLRKNRVFCKNSFFKQVVS
jgi:hypothetical protein